MRSMLFALAASLVLIAPAHAGPSAPGRVEFEVLRNGSPFGRHVVNVTGGQGAFSVASEIELRVAAGPLTLFRYEQACNERWRSGALAGLSCSTLKEGRRTEVSAQPDGDALRVNGAAFPLNVWPTTWWTRPPEGVSTMLNTETGSNMPVRVSRMGRETIEAGGTRVSAERLRVQGTLTVDLWYDDAGRWVGCSFTARGQTITYRLVTPLTSAPA